MKHFEITLPLLAFWLAWHFSKIVVSGLASLVILLAIGAWSFNHFLIAWGIILIAGGIMSLKWVAR